MIGLDSDTLFMAGKVKMNTNPDSNFASGTFSQLQYTNGCDGKDEIIVCLTRVWQSLFCDKTFEFSIQTWQTS